MGPRLVFVHGIGGPRSAETELARWTGALAHGMRLAGHSAAADRLLSGDLIDTAYVYYTDVFSAAPEAPGEQRILVEVLTEAIDQHLAGGGPGDDTTPRDAMPRDTTPRDAMPRDAMLRDARKQLDPTGDAEGLGNVARHLLNACATLLDLRPLRAAGAWLSPKLMVGDLSQVSRYLARGEAHADDSRLDQRVRARVLRELSDDPTIVVSHSLGTVVSFESLHEHTGPVPLWVTMGSPLGLRTVVHRRLRPQPPTTPPTVGRWLNVWDRDDLIAVRSDLAADIAANPGSVTAESVRVDSDGLWVHPASIYLRTPGVAGPIAEAICAVTGRP